MWRHADVEGMWLLKLVNKKHAPSSMPYVCSWKRFPQPRCGDTVVMRTDREGIFVITIIENPPAAIEDEFFSDKKTLFLQ